MAFYKRFASLNLFVLFSLWKFSTAIFPTDPSRSSNSSLPPLPVDVIFLCLSLYLIDEFPNGDMTSDPHRLFELVVDPSPSNKVSNDISLIFGVTDKGSMSHRLQPLQSTPCNVIQEFVSISINDYLEKVSGGQGDIFNTKRNISEVAKSTLVIEISASKKPF